MRKTIALLLALACLVSLLPALSGRADAANKQYDLYVCGVQVTDANKDNILGDHSAFYDSAKNELLLLSRSGQDLNVDGHPVVDNRIKGLTVNIAFYSIYADNTDAAFRSTTDVTFRLITNEYSLYTKDLWPVNLYCGEGVRGFVAANGATMTFEDSAFHIFDAAGSIVGSSGKEKLVLRRANLSCSSDEAAMYNFKSIVLEDCKLLDQAGAHIKGGSVVDTNGRVCLSAEFKDTAKRYCVFVDGISVHEKNRNDVLGDGGKVKYDPKTKTLTLSNPSFTFRKGYAVMSGVEDLTITGKAKITCDNLQRFLSPGRSYAEIVALNPTAPIVLDGDFELDLPAYHGSEEEVLTCGIWAYEKLTVAGGKLKITATGPISLSGEFVAEGGEITLNGEMFAVKSWDDTEQNVGISLKNGMKILTPKNGKIKYYEETYDGLEMRAYACEIVDAKGKPALKVKIAAENPFVDVKTSDSFYNAVLWAAYHKPYQVTAGIDKTHFGPDKTVTRAQAMTFFWAAKDRPKFKKANTQFVDVKKTDWYYKSVMWAVENGITAGTDATHFSPNKTCNRGEILAFLYAAMKKPKVKIKNPYKDVTNQWYKKAALWAYEQRIEKGENGKFNASTPCTRASTVTYLYRFLERRSLLD